MSEPIKLNYSNPRIHAVIENWPSGSKRVTATFAIESNKGKERATRTTTGATKKLTYAHQARIVDGDDGRTYLAMNHGWAVYIMRGDMKFMQENITQDDPRFAAAVALFNQE